MDSQILLLVLLAAVLHASWNALVKTSGDALVRLAIVNMVAALCALPLALFSPLPAAASWPFLIASVLIHQGYYLCLVQSYRFGDLSHVYPIARGIAPLLVAVGAFVFAGERLSLIGVAAVVLICAAILSLAFERGWRRRSAPAVLFALATGVCIAAYTICDGLGGRLAGDVVSYISWLFVIESVPVAVLAIAWRGQSLVSILADHWRTGSAGGVLAFAAYGLVIWAMSLTPMTYVSALRETSVIVAALIGTRLLREPFGPRRVAAATVVALGVGILQLSRE